MTVPFTKVVHTIVALAGAANVKIDEAARARARIRAFILLSFVSVCQGLIAADKVQYKYIMYKYNNKIDTLRIFNESRLGY